jgi:hypothetical protein
MREEIGAAESLHLAVLQEAGFREVGILWQRGDNRIVLPVR